MAGRHTEAKPSASDGRAIMPLMSLWRMTMEAKQEHVDLAISILKDIEATAKKINGRK